MQANKNEAKAAHKARLYLGIAAQEFKNGKTREEVRKCLSKCSDNEFNLICNMLKAREAYDKAVAEFIGAKEAYCKCMEEKYAKD